jgi:hypothetical protein
MDSLFIRPPETLEGYTPEFSREETLLNLEVIQRQVSGEGMFRGFGAWDDDDPHYQGPARYEYDHYITVAGFRMTAQVPYGYDKFDAAAHIAHQFLSNPKNRAEVNAAAFDYLAEHGAGLDRSKRYWKARAHRSEIEQVKAQIRRLQAKVDRAEHLASLYAIEVKQGRRFTETEKAVVWAELTGGESWPPERID